MSELAPGVTSAESPIDLDAGAIDVPMPGPRLPLERREGGNSALPEALPGVEADLDPRLVQPTAVLRSVVDREAVPKAIAFHLPVEVCKGLATLNIQIVHHQVNGSGARIALDQPPQDLRELRRRSYNPS